MVKIMYCLLFLFGFLFFRNCSSAEKPEEFARLREKMVNRQIINRGVKDKRVIRAMLSVPRHLFVPENYLSESYEDHPLPIGEGQTISQPYIVAFMTEVLNLKPEDRILEIGTGSGYQAAVLAEMVNEVYTIELLPSLADRARNILEQLGYTNIHVKTGDGFKGWPEKAPFDAIIVTCAPDKIPQALVDQLNEGGRIIIPVGSQFFAQELVKGVKKKGRLITKNVLPVRFVPLTRGK